MLVSENLQLNEVTQDRRRRRFDATCTSTLMVGGIRSCLWVATIYPIGKVESAEWIKWMIGGGVHGSLADEERHLIGEERGAPHNLRLVFTLKHGYGGEL